MHLHFEIYMRLGCFILQPKKNCSYFDWIFQYKKSCYLFTYFAFLPFLPHFLFWTNGISKFFCIFFCNLCCQIVNLHTNKVARILGKVENNDRFLKIALYQGDRSSKKVRKIPATAANVNEAKEPLTDPTLLCCAFKKHRIYLFRYHKFQMFLW